MEFASTGPSSSASSTPSPLSPPPQPPNVPLPENATVVPLDPLRAPVELQRYYPSAIAAASAAASSSSLLRLIPGTSGAAGAMSGSGVMKVNQMDAQVLDTELLDLLRIQLGTILAPPFFPPGFMDKYKPELNALLDFLLFRFTIFQNEPTPGMRMQNLRFVNGHTLGISSSSVSSASGIHAPRVSQRLLLGLLYIGGKWGFARLRRHALVAGWADEDQQQQQQQLHPTAADPHVGGNGGSSDSSRGSSPSQGEQWKRWAHRALGRAESLFRLAWLINFLAFLRVGRYPSLLQRLTGMRLVYGDALAGASRSINFQFMNRQLLWEHFTQLALCVVPLVDWDGLRRQVSGLIRQRRLGAGAAGSADGGASIPGAGGADGDMECVVCGEGEAQTPYVTDCGHVYCYYCLKTACLQDDAFACPRCGTFFATSKRWAPGQ